jgi:hypothetical protein
MRKHAALWSIAGPVLAVLLISPFAAAGPRSPQQDVDRTCFVCHGDAELKSSAGISVHVSPADFSASVHGQAGIGCVGCHTDLKGVEDFPHASGLKAVNCSGCHAAYAQATAGGVHGTASPRLAASPVLCKDCHGYHHILPSSDPRSSVHRSNRTATCGRCHAGAGENFAKGRVHELPSMGLRTPAGVVRILYKVLIAVMGAFFLAYVAVDLLRTGRAE